MTSRCFVCFNDQGALYECCYVCHVFIHETCCAQLADKKCPFQCGKTIYARTFFGFVSEEANTDKDVYDYLTETDVDINMLNPVNGDTVFHAICRRNNLHIVKYFFEKYCYAWIKEKNYDRHTIFDIASKNENITKYLKDFFNIPFFEMGTAGDEIMHKYLKNTILNKFLVNHKTGDTIFHAICKNGGVRSVKYVFEMYGFGYNPNTQNKSGNTVMHIACAKCTTSVVAYLTRLYPFFNHTSRNKNGFTIFDIADKYNKINIHKILTGVYLPNN